MRKSLLVLAFASLVALLPAFGDTVVTFTPGNGCGGSTCFGNTFTLTITPTGSTYDVKLDVNTAGNTNTGSAIAAVDFKFGGGITAGTLSQFDGGAITGWNSGLGTLNANTGCNYNANGSFECALDTAFQGLSSSSTSIAGLAYLTPATTHTWLWTGVSASGAIGDVHIGALFGEVDSTTTCTKVRGQCVPGSEVTTYSFKQTGNLSGVGTGVQTPEPASLALLSAGLIGLGGLFRRRK